MRLVLFDIDGTLLLTDGAGRRAIHRALIHVFGETGPADHRFDGKTDPQIVRELMRVVGHGDAHIDTRMQALLDLYVTHLREELCDPAYTPYALPGVHALLDALVARDDIVLGLLTGNLVAGARAKLEAVGIDPSRPPSRSNARASCWASTSGARMSSSSATRRPTWSAGAASALAPSASQRVTTTSWRSRRMERSPPSRTSPTPTPSCAQS